MDRPRPRSRNAQCWAASHAFRAGDVGLTMLSYGTREPNDITYYPRSGVFALRGIGLLGRIEPVDPSEIH